MRIWQHLLGSISVLWVCQGGPTDEITLLNRLSSTMTLQREMFTPKILDFLAQTFGTTAPELSEFLREDLDSPQKVLKIWKSFIEKSPKFDESKFEELEGGLKVVVEMKRNQLLLRRGGIDFGDFEGEDLKSFLVENLSTLAQVPRLKVEIQKAKKVLQLAQGYSKHLNSPKYFLGTLVDTQENALMLCDALWDSLKVVKPMGIVLEGSMDSINAPTDLIQYPKGQKTSEFNDLEPYLLPIHELSGKLEEIRSRWHVDSTRTSEAREITRSIYDITRRSRLLSNFEYVDSIFHKEVECLKKLDVRRTGNFSKLLEQMDWLEGILEGLISHGAVSEDSNSTVLEKARLKIASLFEGRIVKIPTASEVSEIFANTNALEAMKCTQLSSLESILDVVHLLKTVSHFEPRILEETMDYISKVARLQKEIQSLMKARKTEKTLRILGFEGFKDLKEVKNGKEAEEFKKKVREFLDEETRRKTPLRSSLQYSFGFFSFLEFYFWELLLMLLMITFGTIDFFNSRHGFIKKRWIY